MKTHNYGLYAIAVAIAFVGALWLGMPASTLLFLGAVLICPLMMIFMMHGMHGGSHDADASSNRNHHESRNHDDMASQ